MPSLTSPLTPPQHLIDRFRTEGIKRVIPAQTILIHAGDQSNDVYFIEQGRIRFTLLSTNGREPILSEVGEGRIFGELAAIDGHPRAAIASAQTDGIIWTLTKAQFLKALEENWESAHWALVHLAAMLRDMTERNFQLTTMTVRARLACELISEAKGQPDARLNLPTHAEIAARIGTHREAVTRELGKFHKQGWLKRAGKHIVIQDLEALHNVVGTDA